MVAKEYESEMYSTIMLTYFTLLSFKATGASTNIGFNTTSLWAAWWIALSWIYNIMKTVISTLDNIEL